MITKTKGPKLPPSKHATPRTQAAAKKLAASRSVPLTDQVKAEAIEIVRDQFPQLAIECRTLNVEEAEEAIRNTLFAKRVGPQFEFHEDGEPWLIATADGLSVTYQGRDGMLAWLDIASDFAGNEFDDVDTPAVKPASPPQFTSAMIRLDEIAVVRNERTEFDEESLAELAESLKTHGLIEPLVLRLVDGRRYELVAGERRLRAARLAGLVEAPARYAVLTDEQADEVRIVENLQRKDLSAIEEARGFARMLEAHGYTQEKLAERLKCSQPKIANGLRLLKLPEKWQQRIISQEISATHARYVLPWVDYPDVLAGIEKRFYDKNGKPIGGELPSVQEFSEEISWEVDNCTKPLSGSQYEYQLGRSVEIFTPTAAEREQLGVITVDKRYGRKGEKEERATNVKLWNKLRAQQLKPLVAKKAKNAAKKTDQAAREAKKPKEVDRFASDLELWRRNWLKFLIAQEVVAKAAAADRILLFFLAGDDCVSSSEIARLLGFTGRFRSYENQDEAKLAQLIASHQTPLSVVHQAVLETLWRGPFNKSGKPSERWSWEGEHLEAAAAAIGIDLAELWRKELAGPLTEAFFNLHDVDRLCQLGAELDVYIKPSSSKTAAIKLLMGHRNTKLKLPSVIKPVAPLAAPKKAAKPKKGKA